MGPLSLFEPEDSAGKRLNIHVFGCGEYNELFIMLRIQPIYKFILELYKQWAYVVDFQTI